MWRYPVALPIPGLDRVFRRVGWLAADLMLLGGIWVVLALVDSSRVRVIPWPGDVLDAMIRSRETLLTFDIPQTMIETLLGLGLALVLGIALAALLDFSPLLKRLLYPILVTSQVIPIVAIAPALILIFGFGLEPKVIVVLLFCFFPIAVATIDGLTAADPDLVALLRAMGASRGQVWRKVRFPSALPSLFSGLRVAATYSMTGAIIGEYITSQYGLGHYLRIAFSSANTAQAFVPIVITVVLSIGLVLIVGAVERIVLPWYFTQAREAQWSEPGIY